MTKWYGSLDNRLMENSENNVQIVVGMKATQTHYSDRDVWEVIEVQDQKHVTVREMKAIHVGEAFTNNWELESNENGHVMRLTKRGKGWYETATVTAEEWLEADREQKEGNFEKALNIVVRGGFDPDKIMEKGKQTKWYKRNMIFELADYYYDYEF